VGRTVDMDTIYPLYIARSIMSISVQYRTAHVDVRSQSKKKKKRPTPSNTSPREMSKRDLLDTLAAEENRDDIRLRHQHSKLTSTLQHQYAFCSERVFHIYHSGILTALSAHIYCFIGLNI